MLVPCQQRPPAVRSRERQSYHLRGACILDWTDEGQTFRFMGQVANVQLNVASQWVDRKVTTKLKPAALRPKEKAGSCE